MKNKKLICTVTSRYMEIGSHLIKSQVRDKMLFFTEIFLVQVVQIEVVNGFFTVEVHRYDF